MKKNCKIYLIEWQDAHVENIWIDDNEIDAFVNESLYIVQDIGWILAENDKCLVMASSQNNAGQWGTLKKIPKTWIRKKILYKWKK